MALAALAVGLLAWFSGVVPGVPGGLVRVEPDEAATLVPGERALSELATPEALTTRAAADERSAAAGEAIRERDRTVDGASAGLQPLITGRVLDAKGAPCAGARVIAATGWDQFVPIELGDLGQVSSSIQRALVETDVDGRFEVLDSLSLRGELVLHVSAPGHAPLRLERLPPRARGASSPADYGDLRLRAGSVVGGRVIDPSGAAVPGARLRLAVVRGEQGFAVDLEARGVPLAVAADDGSFGIEQLEGGPFTLLVDAPGRCAARVTGVASARPLDGLTVVLEAGSSIAGKVTGLEVRARAGETPKPLRVEARPGKPGEPVEGQGRAVGGARLAALAGDGSFQLDGLVDGLPYTLIVSEDRGERAGWVRAREVAPTEGTPGTRDLELAWDPQRCATFRVVDDRTGAPIEAFVAQWRTCPPPDPGRGDGLQLVTDGDPQNRPRTRFEGGVVTLDSLPSGEVEAELTVKITAVGYETKVVDTFVVRGGFETNLGEVRLTAAPTVRVAVRVKGTGTPVPGAGVYLAKRGVKALDWYVTSGRGEFGDDSVKYGVTGDDGVAVVTSLPGQRITIMVVSDRYATAEVKEHLLRPEGGDELVVEVSEGGTLVVRVCRPNGTPAEGVKVLRRRFDPGPNGDNNAHSEVVTDAEGLVRFARLPAGMHEATVWPRPVANGVAKAWVPVLIPLKGEVLMTLDAPASSTLNGRVLESGVPLARAFVSINPAGADKEIPDWHWLYYGPNKIQRLTRADGSFTLGPIEAGDWVVTVNHESRALATRVPVTILDGVNTLDVRLDVARLQGRVLDERANPVPQLAVQVFGEREDLRGETPRNELSENSIGDVGSGVKFTRTDNTRTNAAGVFEFRGLTTERPLRLTVEGEYIEPLSLTLTEFTGNEQRDLGVLQTKPAGVILVRTADSEGAANLKVRLVAASPEPAVSGREVRKAADVRDGEGRRWTSVPPGTYRVEAVDDAGNPTRSMDVEVRARETATVRL